ncbi:MAG: DUF4342 domain-containing protein [Candidatus Kerfeldbacteria bacterium]|nr:DUF4342 domain-containing protein [Candidatus Kerfeldbacteria bacterium]
MPTGRQHTEAFTVSGQDPVEKVKALVREGNSRRIIIKED